MEAKVAEQGRTIAGLERRALALTRVFTWSTGAPVLHVNGWQSAESNAQTFTVT